MRFIVRLTEFKFNIKDSKQVSVLLIMLASLFVYAYQIGQKVSIISDFAVFWHAGNNFSNNVSLYSGIGGACRYIYPPFAAMCFQVLALCEMHLSATIYTLFNLGFFALIIYYSYQILRFFSTNTVYLYTSILVGTLLSLRFFLYHFMFVQMNELVLLLSLSGIYHYLKNKIYYSVPLLVFAVFIKIIPIFILIWILSKRFSWQTYFLALFCFLLGILLPISQRGMEQGMVDLQEYYITFLEPFQNGGVEPKLQNYGLSASLYKVFSSTPDGLRYDYIITLLPFETIGLMNKFLILSLLTLFAALLALSRFVYKAISIFEISFILLFTHLVSGITWEYHLVSLLFIYATLAFTYLNNKSAKLFWSLLLVIAVFNAILGADTVGFYLYYKACGFSILTWFMLLLTFLTFLLFLKDKNRVKLIT